MKRTKKIICVTLLSLILLLCLFGCNNENTLSFPDAFEVIELRQSNFISDLTKYCHSKATFDLKEDITLTEDWEPIGQTVGTAFNGTIKGNGHTISGLKTKGWEYDGTPVTILRRIMGWKANGTPVYNSSKIIDGGMTTRQNNGFTEVTNIVREGDSEDPDYIDMMDNGVEETKTSFGSIGLFGYTYGATIDDLVIEDADFKFYCDGEYAFAGFISGYDIASDFTKITVKNSSIAASNIVEDVVYYQEKDARASEIRKEISTKQYLGGIVGYSRGNMTVSGTNYAYKQTKFENITVTDISLYNKQYTAIFDAKLEVGPSDYSLEKTADSNILKTELEPEEMPGKYKVIDDEPVKQVFVGAISGYSVGAKIDTVTVSGVNENGGALLASKVNAGGIASSLLGAESSAKNFTVSNVCFLGENVNESAMIGGAFGEVKSAKIDTNCIVKDTKMEILRSKGIGSVCIGGFAAYCDEDAYISDAEVDSVAITSDYIASGSLGSILGGLVGVLRDSSVETSQVKNVTFKIINNNSEKDDYCYTSNGISQIYGNSTVTGTIKTINCKYFDETVEKEYTKIKPVIAKNNYVNEDGESSARLYYKPNDKTAGVYVTVFADLIPTMKNGAYRMRKTTIWEEIGDAEKALLKEGDEMTNRDKLYYWRHQNPETMEYIWNVIEDIDSIGEEYKVYDPTRTYGFAKEVYRIELPSSAIGKDIPSGFFTYDIKEGVKTIATGKFLADTDYYVALDTEIGQYELDITVYSESDQNIVVQKGKTEDDDVLAKATYVVSLDQFREDVIETDEWDNDFVLCAAELYLDVYFKAGEGFLTDRNGFVITDASRASNRNFASYVLVDGRPNVPVDSITYQSAEE